MPISPPKRKLEKTKAFSKDVKMLPHAVLTAGWRAAQILQEDIFSSRLNIKKLEGYDQVWRVVIKKNYRMIYCFDADTVYLL